MFEKVFKKGKKKATTKRASEGSEVDSRGEVLVDRQ